LFRRRKHDLHLQGDSPEFGPGGCSGYWDNIKGKAVPLQAWSGPEGSRKLRFPDFMIAAQDGGKVVSLTHRPPLPQEILMILISVRG